MAQQKNTVTFKEIMTELKISRRKLGEYLERIGERCKAVGLPIITVLVVYAGTNKVGKGYKHFEPNFENDPSLAQNEQHRVWNNKSWVTLVSISVKPSQIWINDIVCEGTRKRTERLIPERSAKLRSKCLKEKGRKCVICGFDGDEKYGKPHADIIQVHHKNPLSAGVRETTLDDLEPVCPNCHAVIHSKKGGGIYTIEEVKRMLLKSGNTI